MTKAKLPKLSFKNQAKEKGLGAVGRPWAFVDICRDGQKIGYIMPKSYINKAASVHFMIKTGEGSWDWMHMKKKFDPQEIGRNPSDDAKAWVKENWAALCEAYGDKFHENNF